MRNFAHSASTSASVSSGEQVTGSVTMPASDRFTTSTWAACASGDRLRCSTPSPPARAIAMAIRDSVTVSIGDDTSGTLIRTRRVTWVLVSTALGTTSDSAGSSSTSSNVRPSIANFGGKPENSLVITAIPSSSAIRSQSSCIRRTSPPSYPRAGSPVRGSAPPPGRAAEYRRGGVA